MGEQQQQPSAGLRAGAGRWTSRTSSVFDVSAVVLEGGGGDTGALVCGASLALADAGVEGLDLVPGCGVPCVPNALSS
eukprot:XP_001691798.1 predicted protein [Chlamydomonas reinhardtii]